MSSKHLLYAAQGLVISRLPQPGAAKTRFVVSTYARGYVSGHTIDDSSTSPDGIQGGTGNDPPTSKLSRVVGECSGSADGGCGVAIGINNTCGRVRPTVINAYKLHLSTRCSPQTRPLFFSQVSSKDEGRLPTDVASWSRPLRIDGKH